VEGRTVLFEAQNPRARNTVILGPWTHGGWIRGGGDKVADAQFGFKTADGFRALLLAFFKHHLKTGPDPKLPEALVFETGANRWRSFTAWPPRETVESKFFLGANGTLTTTAPTETGADRRGDPAHPCRTRSIRRPRSGTASSTARPAPAPPPARRACP
jgi:predicted acyl esterase